ASRLPNFRRPGRRRLAAQACRNRRWTEREDCLWHVPPPRCSGHTASPCGGLAEAFAGLEFLTFGGLPKLSPSVQRAVRFAPGGGKHRESPARVVPLIWQR